MKLEHDEPLSNHAYKFNLRRYIKAQEEEKAFRFCVQTMMPDLLRYWDQKAKDGKLPAWTEASEHGKGLTGQPGITNAVLVQTAMELDPTAQREVRRCRLTVS